MNLYGGPMDQYFNNEEKQSKNFEAESTALKFNLRKSEMGERVLTEEQILQLKEKYDLSYLTCEEEESLLQDLSEMGIITKEDCGSYIVSGGNIFESLNRQVSADINLLYRMAIAGRYSNRHIEHIRSQQKLLEVLEQLVAD